MKLRLVSENTVFDLEKLIDEAWSDLQDAFANQDRLDIIAALRGLRWSVDVALDSVCDGVK